MSDSPDSDNLELDVPGEDTDESDTVIPEDD